MEPVPVVPWAPADILRKLHALQSLLEARQHQMALTKTTTMLSQVQTIFHDFSIHGLVVIMVVHRIWQSLVYFAVPLQSAVSHFKYITPFFLLYTESTDDCYMHT